MRTDRAVERVAQYLSDDQDKPIPQLLRTVLDRYPSPPASLNRDQLVEIARVKNGGRLAASKSLKALEGNSQASVRRLTSLAFAESDPETQMRLLIGLGGVKVPTASAILAWTRPAIFPVIDRRACRTLNAVLKSEIDPKSVSGWVSYVEIVRGVARLLKVTPFVIDRRLYYRDRK